MTREGEREREWKVCERAFLRDSKYSISISLLHRSLPTIEKDGEFHAFRDNAIPFLSLSVPRPRSDVRERGGRMVNLLEGI